MSKRGSPPPAPGAGRGIRGKWSPKTVSMEGVWRMTQRTFVELPARPIRVVATGRKDDGALLAHGLVCEGAGATAGCANE